MKIAKIKYILILIVIIASINMLYNLNTNHLSNNLINATESNKNIEMINKKSDLENFNNINIDINISDIQIIPSDEFKIDIKYREDENEVRYEVINKTLIVKQVNDKNDFKLDTNAPKKESRGYIKIYINENINMENININSYISEININKVNIYKLNIDCQVGEIDLNNINVHGRLEIEDEMGNINIKDSKIYKINLVIGSGDINITDCNINSINIYSDAGNIELNDSKISENSIIICKLGKINITGFLFGNTKINSENGNIKIKLLEDEKNYNYNIECNLGDFNLNGKKYNKRIIVDNNKKHNIDITCDIGNVNLEFKK